MLHIHFERRGTALALCPVSHTDRSVLLNNLTNLLSSRFDHRGNDDDLDEAIALHREALVLCPIGHTHRSMSLNKLANRLSTRFQHQHNGEDLDQAISLYMEALALCLVGHTHRSMWLNNLHRGNNHDLDKVIALHREALALFLVRNNEDLDEAIALHREALALCPVGHTHRSMSLNNFMNQLSSRFDHQGNDKDLDQAIALDREVLALRPVGHTDRSMSLNNLATQLSSHFQHRGNDKDLDQAIAFHREALALRPVNHTHQSMSLNNLATQLSSRFGHQGNDEDLNQAIALGREALALCPGAANVVSGGLLFRLRASLLWVTNACQHSHVTELEAYATSMQLLDAYMSKTASVLSRHKIMKDFPSTLAVDAALCALHSDDMTRLRTPLDSLQTRGDHAMALMKRFRDLMEDWNRAIEEIWEIEGFSRFLLPPLFSDLQDAACDEPIIILIASKSSCHAIIIPHKQPPTSIQLPTDFLKLAKLVVALQQAVGKEAGSRIWWCLTSLFNFLLLHAAGEYRARGKSVSQQYISSYMPSLTTLIKASGASFTLDAVEPELELVQRLLPPPPTISFSKITSVDATKSRALRALRDNTWTQKIDEPFKSAFLMRDKPLSLLDIIQTDLSQHEFTFLSACETAVSVFTAGLQFAGVNSVVGTMWKVTDSTVQHLVEAFYKNMHGDGCHNPITN
ncbi:uncharacterized protein F5891DRAFT_1131179 [Suillus fuscotomentosus]|uniref:CHAT domain-containing protein n=1 Tax=Suillus fuscotomentosus TaxID=1912939 RepID=A0AAD4DTJ2_9AGAM|nr:uncharacterized protein F5891DRAFT_1131179 [Suillus fuscotomentosus]KAG1893661.1 hypothetical protein F5891DRAFT_1131179 [Suillus fuscotomentosus]